MSVLVHDAAHRLELLWEGEERRCFCVLGGYGTAFVLMCAEGAGPLSVLLFTVARGSSCIPGLLLSSCIRVSPWPWRIIWKTCLCFLACSLNIFYSINLADALSNFWSGNEAGTVESLTCKHLFPALHRLCTVSGAEGAAGCAQVYKLLRPYKEGTDMQGAGLLL